MEKNEAVEAEHTMRNDLMSYTSAGYWALKALGWKVINYAVKIEGFHVDISFDLRK